LIAIFSKLFHFSAAAAPMSPFIARITPGRFVPEGVLWVLWPEL